MDEKSLSPLFPVDCGRGGRASGYTDWCITQLDIGFKKEVPRGPIPDS